MNIEENGICPNCETTTGPVGTVCSSESCATAGYHYIPVPWFDRSKASAIKDNRSVDPRIGRLLDRYLLAGKLGEGGMGTVYVGIQKPLFREVAIKLISGWDLSRNAVGRFEREARAISNLDHPNIVKIYDYGIADLDGQIPYMALEYLNHGRTLRKIIQNEQDKGEISYELVSVIFDQILVALGAAHKVGIVHRDIKPDNIMLVQVHGNQNFVKVLDFGLAKSYLDDSALERDVSGSGQIIGTPCYMAPEQIPTKRDLALDGRADLYAVGVVLFEFFCNARPFYGESTMAILARKIDPEYDPMEQPSAKRLPKGLRTFLAKSIARDPNERWHSAEKMAHAMHKVLDTTTTARVGGFLSAATAPAPSTSTTDKPVKVETQPQPESTPYKRPQPPAASPYTHQDRRLRRPGGLDVDWGDDAPVDQSGGDTRNIKRPVQVAGPAGDPVPASKTRARRIQWDVLLNDLLDDLRDWWANFQFTPFVLRRIGLGVAGLVVLALVFNAIHSSIQHDDTIEQMELIRTELVQKDRFVGFDLGLMVEGNSLDYRLSGKWHDLNPEGYVEDAWGNQFRFTYDLKTLKYIIQSTGPDGIAEVCREDDEDSDDICLELAGR